MNVDFSEIKSAIQQYESATGERDIEGRRAYNDALISAIAQGGGKKKKGGKKRKSPKKGGKKRKSPKKGGKKSKSPKKGGKKRKTSKRPLPCNQITTKSRCLSRKTYPNACMQSKAKSLNGRFKCVRKSAGKSSRKSSRKSSPKKSSKPVARKAGESKSYAGATKCVNLSGNADACNAQPGCHMNKNKRCVLLRDFGKDAKPCSELHKYEDKCNRMIRCAHSNGQCELNKKAQFVFYAINKEDDGITAEELLKDIKDADGKVTHTLNGKWKAIVAPKPVGEMPKGYEKILGFVMKEDGTSKDKDKALKVITANMQRLKKGKDFNYRMFHFEPRVPGFNAGKLPKHSVPSDSASTASTASSTASSSGVDYESMTEKELRRELRDRSNRRPGLNKGKHCNKLSKDKCRNDVKCRYDSTKGKCYVNSRDMDCHKYYSNKAACENMLDCKFDKRCGKKDKKGLLETAKKVLGAPVNAAVKVVKQVTGTETIEELEAQRAALVERIEQLNKAKRKATKEAKLAELRKISSEGTPLNVAPAPSPKAIVVSTEAPSAPSQAIVVAPSAEETSSMTSVSDLTGEASDDSTEGESDKPAPKPSADPAAPASSDPVGENIMALLQENIAINKKLVEKGDAVLKMASEL